MKALVLEEYNRFCFKEVPAPKPGRGEVLIAVKACGICGSDVHGMDGSTGRRRPPIIMGHEASGVVAQLGQGVSASKPGERVTFDSTIFCGECEFCRRGEVNLCNNRRVLGVSCDEYRQHGAFAEFAVVPEKILYPLPAQLSFEQAALIEPFAIALHAARRGPATRGGTAAVVGCGMIGLALVQAVREMGFERILACDIAPEKLDLARKLGAHETINSAAVDGHAAILHLTNGRGVDHSFEAVGISATVDLAIRSVRKGGAVTLVGNVAPKIDLPLQIVVTRELSVYGSCASAGEYPDCLKLMASGAFNPAPLLSAVAPLSEGAKWFDRLYQKETGLLKVVLKP